MTKLQLTEAGLAVLVFFGLVLGFGSYSIVSSGSRGVVTHFGKVQDGVMDEGIHFKFPIVSTVHKISIRVQKSDIKTEASSKDLQKVNTEFNINWHPKASEVNQMFQEIGDEDDVVERVLAPAVSEVLKAATAKRTAEEIISKRMELKDEIDAVLKERINKYHVVIDDINLVNMTFSDDFNQAIEQKQIAEQDALKAKYVAEKATQDAQAMVNKATGEANARVKLAEAQAESQKLIQHTITPEILQLEFYKKWDGSFPNVMVNGGGGKGGGIPFMLNMPLNGSKD